jgi:hypothetical protein
MYGYTSNDSNVCGEPPNLPGKQGGGMSTRLNAAPVVVGTGVGLRQVSLLLDQHSWRAGNGSAWLWWDNWTERQDGANRTTETLYQGWDEVAGGWWNKYVEL